MPSPTAASASASAAPDINWESEEWELLNDDGFVYKRKKRRTDPNTVASPPDSASNSELELKWRRERKRRVLLKLKAKYEREISLWDNWLNTMKTMEERVKEKQKNTERYDKGKETRREEMEERMRSFFKVELDCISLVDKLVLKVQEQEAIISHVTNLCDVVEELCSAQQEKIVKSYIDLPIWGSPRELMATLCED